MITADRYGAAPAADEMVRAGGPVSAAGPAPAGGSITPVPSAVECRVALNWLLIVAAFGVGFMLRRLG